MDLLRRHEAFEIEVLEQLKNAGFLQRLAFGGGTILRLCHDMQRYSSDLDFWLLRAAGWKSYHTKLQAFLKDAFEPTDSDQKFFTLLYEIRAEGSPRRLKLEIRRKAQRCDVEETIAFSQYGPRQVLVRGLTLEQTMRNKVEALLGRGEIRDAFDIEFLLRRGVSLPTARQALLTMEQIVHRFTPRDYRVTLGSLLEPDLRAYYQDKGFIYLTERIRAALGHARG